MYENDREEALGLLRKTIDSISPLPDNDFEQLAQVMHYRKYNKGEVVLKEDKVCRHFWFILKGGFRIYSLETGLEVNVRFFFEQSLATDFISLRHGIPFNFFIIALEETEVLYSYKPDYRCLQRCSEGRPTPLKMPKNQLLFDF